ncbi:hypothetical protein FNF29_05541 [Cafeteria roenbergensis]|uniref:AAA+ ATPase domain-containing protein n=1 Tax=Cafeteria roenbergensis TaxID=33653 RepID=A0A5A8CGU0_CAFRO|nr:hypothetical protein FNF29_05541 [Cafeteria roenbergensis]KAA0151340.1 hypothetical protein FNF28_07145 [Cafeteria roenbergensis]|eukprot:KAA0150101.1 hypothetical protein FNF29_05541 [Cafeteria roenbergensis]
MVSAAAQATVNSGTGTELSASAASEAFVVSFLRARAALMGAGARGATRLRRAVATPAGVYLHGGVGTGKTMCVDAFAAACAADGVATAEPGGAGLSGDASDARGKVLVQTALPQGAGGVRRVHHHAFLMEVHERMHAWLQGPGSSAGAVAAVASDVAAGRAVDGSGLSSPVRLLCIDELQVYDAADAALLGQVLTALVERGVCVVVTSNRAPSELFANGLNRDLVKPLVRAVQAACTVVAMDSEHGAGAASHGGEAPSGTVPATAAAVRGRPATEPQLPDFRRRLAAPAGTVLWATGPGADAEGAEEAGMRLRFEAVVGAVQAAGARSRGVPAASEAASDRLRLGPNASRFGAELDVGFGRRVALPEVAGGGRCLWAPFGWLCGQEAVLGPADFRAIMRAFDVVAVPGVPALGFQERNEARRFITAVDVAYEEGVVLLAGLQAHPDALFAGLAETASGRAGVRGGGAQVGDASAAPPVARVLRQGGSSSSSATTFVAGPGDEQVEWSATGRIGASLGEATGVADTAFAHSRTASRLMELAGADYAASLAAERGFRLPSFG